MVIVPHDGAAMAKGVEIAHEAGIPTISYDRLITGTDKIDLYVTFDNVKVGVLQATYLADALKVSNGKLKVDMAVSEDKLDRMVAFLMSDKPMAKNIEVSFAGKDVPLRHDEIELAIDEVVEEWIDFEELFASQDGLKISHPYYGPLDFQQWMRLHAKHFTHHLEQFGIK